MKPTLLLAFLSAAVVANARGTFSLIETNPQRGTEQFNWSDSSKHVYGAGELSYFTELNGSLYYYGQDTTGNEELWKTDGTSQGTMQVKDINPLGSSQMGNMMAVGNHLVFVAADNNDGDFDLYASDGTPNGTVKIAEMNETWNDALSSQRAAVYNNTILFCTSTSLMSTDGTVGGTKKLLTLVQYNPAQGYCELNGIAYFILTGSSGKPQLWQTDGTTNGTKLAYDLGESASQLIWVEKLLAFNGKLYMVASASGQGSDLFTFDGSQLQHVELVSGSNAYPTSLNVINNQLFFIGSNMAHTSLYRLTATDVMPQIIPSVADMDVYGSLSFCNNSVYFSSADSKQIHSVNLGTLALSTLTLNGYTLPSYWITPDAGFLTGGGGKIFFAAYDSATGNQVFIESDGTEAGTFSVMPQGVNNPHPFNIILSCGAADVFDFKMWGNKVVVPANFNDAGRELWIYEPQALVSGVEPVEAEMAVSVFPNPTAKELFVRLQSAGNGYCDMDVIDIVITNTSGQLMLQNRFIGNATQIDVSGFAAGNYCLSVTGANKAISTHRFVVTK